VQVATTFGRAINHRDFATAEACLAVGCMYVTPHDVFRGVDATRAALRDYSESMAPAFNDIESSFTVEPASDGAGRITFIDCLTFRGHKHEYRYQLTVDVATNGKITHIRRNENRGERGRLNDFLDGAGVPVPSGALCRLCGYALEGLPRNSSCPECGVPLSASRFRREFLERSGFWLQRVRSGMALTQRAAIRMFFLFGGWITASLLFVPEPWRALGVLAIWVVGFPFYLRGLWLLTTPSEHLDRQPGVYFARLVVRDCVIGAVVTMVASFLAWYVWDTPGLVVVNLVGMPIGFGGLPMFWYFGRYVEALANFVADDFIARRAKLYRRGFLISGLLFIPGVAGVFGFGGSFSFPILIGPCILLLGLPGYFGFGLLLSTLPLQLGGWLVEEGQIARST